MDDGKQTVADLLPPGELDKLADFAVFMLGEHRSRTEIFDRCRLSVNVDAPAFADCWFTFDRWQGWLEDFARNHNS